MLKMIKSQCPVRLQMAVIPGAIFTCNEAQAQRFYAATIRINAPSFYSYRTGWSLHREIRNFTFSCKIGNFQMVYIFGDQFLSNGAQVKKMVRVDRSAAHVAAIGLSYRFFIFLCHSGSPNIGKIELRKYGSKQRVPFARASARDPSRRNRECIYHVSVRNWQQTCSA